MSGLNQIPTDYKKFLDQVLKLYQRKENPVAETFRKVNADSGKTIFEYAQLTQTYATAKGWTAFTDPTPLADGANPPTDDLGTSDATASPTTFGKSFRVDRKVLNSSEPVIKDTLTQAAVEQVEIIKNYVNRSLLTSMSANAGQSYTATGGTWSTTGDPVADVNSSMAAFKQSSGGLDADFILINPNEYADVKNDTRFQNTLYTTKSIETGTITPKPFGIDWIVDQSVTTGTFFLGKKGMFADLIVTEDFVSSEKDDLLAGKVYGVAYTFVPQFKLPFYLLAGTGI